MWISSLAWIANSIQEEVGDGEEFCSGEIPLLAVEAIPESGNRNNKLRVARVDLDLLAKPENCDINRSREGRAAIPPNIFQQGIS